MAAYHVVYISRRVILKLIEHKAYAKADWWSVVFEPIITNFISVSPIIILVLVATKIMIDRKVKWIYLVITHLVLFLLYTMLITASAALYHYFVYGFNILEEEGFIVSTLFGSNLNFLGYVGFVTIIYSYYYIQKVARMEIRDEKLSQQLQNIKMQALKSQLNPHFLFNTLHGISSLIKTNPNKARLMIGNLGDLLREVLLVKDENMVSVGKEMSILNKYIDIMQTRFSDHLSVESVITEKAKEALIPSMLLQPLVENSFEHGFSYDHTNLSVKISISTTEKWLIIQIQNNGASIALNSTDSGLGIRNVQERLETLYGDNFEFSFSNLNKEQGVITEIKIPLAAA